MTTSENKRATSNRYSYEYRVGQVERVLRLSRQGTSYDISKEIGLSQQRTLLLLHRMFEAGLLEVEEVFYRQLEKQTIYKKVWRLKEQSK